MLDFVQWHPSQERGCVNSLQMEVLVTSRLLGLEGKQFLNIEFNQVARLGLVTVKMVCRWSKLMDLLTIRTNFPIPRGYNFMWDKLQ